ncbi:MAG TPA: replicative DNA helicase [Kiritimatiellia bacterium]|nr:replicative DNA helicase [Kiritimatiellia bacterium]HPA78384.1 replicative DNA helicase [Kiritimatiellia bacterium]
MAGKTAKSAAPKSDRVPPHSEEAEKSILGSIFLDSDRVIDLCMTRGLVPESFYEPRHRSLFEVFVQMNRENRSIDMVTVRDRLETLGRLEDVGGYDYIERLVDSTPTAIHAEHYADIVFQKYLLRRIIDRSREAIDRCYESDEDAPIVLNKTEQAILEISQTQHQPLEQWDKLVEGVMKEIMRSYETKTGLTGIPSGYKDIDDKLQGFKPGELVILAARPSQGKTSLALNIAENLAMPTHTDPDPRPVAVFSLEMSSESLVRRMICSRARVSASKITGGYISRAHNDALTNAATALLKAPIYLDDTAALEALEVRSRARRLKRNYDVQMIIVDYLQIMNFAQYSKEGRQRETSAISATMKAMAKELKVPVLVLSQLSRNPENRTGPSAAPKLSDLRDSGSIEQDADVVLMLRRPSSYPEDKDHADEKLAIVNVAKNRNGPTGDIKLNFFADYTRFETRYEGVDEPGAAVTYEDEE